MGLAIKPECVARRHSAKLKSFLYELFDKRKKQIINAHLKKPLVWYQTLDIEDSIQSIKSYFSRRASLKRIQKVKDKENAPQTGEPLQEEEGRNGDDDEDIDVKVY